MRLARFAIGAFALMSAGFGVLLLAVPDALRIVGIDAFEPAGRIELRAFYGGLELGLAVFLGLALRHGEWFRPVLLLQSLALGGIAAARIIGLLLEPTRNPVIFLALLVEAAGALLSLVALRRLPHD